MMRALLVLMVLLLLPGEVMADGAAWHKKHVVVRDYLPQARKADLEAIVAAFNEVMPKRGPRLVYIALPEVPCSEARTLGGIAVCEDRKVSAGETTYVIRGHVISAARITLSDLLPGPLCHELMHALTDIPDVAPEQRRSDSCVHVWMERPGAFDVRYLRWAYKKFGRNHR